MRVLQDAQADRDASGDLQFGPSLIFYRRSRPFAARRRSTAPGSSSTSWNATTPDGRVAGGLPDHGCIRRLKMPQIEQHVQPDEDQRVQQRRAEKHQKPRQRLRHDELGADDSRQESDQRLGQTRLSR